MNRFFLLGIVQNHPEISFSKRANRKLTELYLEVTDNQGSPYERKKVIPVGFFEDRADQIKEKVSKYDLVFVEGYISGSSFVDREGQTRHRSNLYGREFNVLRKKTKS